MEKQINRNRRLPGILGVAQKGLILMRPHHYIKNFFIFLPPFFSGEFNQFTVLLNSTIAFAAFSLSASGIYIFNDFKDKKRDSLHPKKKYRPIASGDISTPNAILIMGGCFIVSAMLAMQLSFKTTLIIWAYILLNIGYSILLKHIALIDITCIATGFVLRLFTGAIATETQLSMWIIIMTFLLALFLAFSKRRTEIKLFLDRGTKTRKVIDGYSLQFIDFAMTIMASVIVVSYIMFTVFKQEEVQSNYLYFSALFVLMGILRYLQIVFVENGIDSPTRVLLKDRFLQIDIVAWLLFFVPILYL